MYWLLAFGLVAILSLGFLEFIAPNAHAQEVITVPSTDPCFLNYTAGLDMLDNCGYDEDYLVAATAPWQWITGGHFSMILVSVLALMTYIKYHKAVYPMLIGIMFLPISYFLFPDEFLTFGFLMVGALIAILIWYVFIRQTKEYSG